MALLHVIILNYRTPDMTLRCVEAALGAMEGIDGGITIVENGSEDGSLQRLQDEGKARGWLDGNRVALVDSGRNGGFGAGNNVGIRAGLPDGRQADLVYLLNSDAFPRTDAIRVLIDYLAAHPECGIACSRLRGDDDVPHDTAFRFPSAGAEFEGAARSGPITRMFRGKVVTIPQPDASRAVDWSAGASMMIRREVLDEIGLFDETFFLYFEETDLCRRAGQAGWQTHYVWDSLVTHIGSASTGAKTWATVPEYWYASRQHYFQKHHGRAGAFLATLAWLTGDGLWRLRCLVQRRDHDTPKGHGGQMLKRALGRG
ncbi:glycosyltransferase family 2 protein [Paracoccus tegillarcae]|uniref:Glycosyl transferase n=1 Tax=Paracoccus tegillarcae TaxID=1529068 RepID=A0A2K9EK77_9RHOB|nr:glycosyltransferase family 2 protein [Paracoccus tegillarcae]AUH35448.1 glycosyl transferase [Paracoccus tegillarcae]